jgi:beta-lactamase class A
MGLLLSKLKASLSRAADDFSGVLGIAVKDLTTGDELLVNGNEVFPIASSIKIAILVGFFDRVESGQVDPDEPLGLGEERMVGGSGVLKELAAGSVTMSIFDYATLMITVSDNTATNICIDLAGMGEINDALAKLGLTETRLVRKMMDLASLAAGKENVSTPRETMTLMECLFSGKGVSPFVRERTLEILKKPKEGLIEGVIRNSVPDDVPVADKSGWVEGAMCDVGIVFLRNRPYAISIMAKHVPTSDPKKLNAIREMTHVTGLVHEYFEEVDSATRYGRRTRA